MTRACVALILLATIAACPAFAEMTLAGGGETDYAVVVDPDAIAPEKHAAAELASFLGQVTGAQFEVVESAVPIRRPCLYVGPGAASREIAPDLPYDALAPDGIVIETVGANMILAGDRPRGTLYAVYTFLEDTVGCRWWSSTASFIPEIAELTVPDQHVRYVPALEYRETFWWDAFDGDWACRNKSVGNRPRLEEHHGGGITYEGFVHTFNRLIPDAEFAEHPEWFSERDGERIGGPGVRSQLCLTNPEVLDVVEARVRERLAANPTAGITSVSQNDWDRHCLCEDCLALEEQDGSPCGPLLRFVNAIAERIGPDFPEIAVDTLAYQYTRKPPANVVPLPNVIIRLCSIECSFLQTLESETNSTFGDDIRGWNEICDRLYVWDYTTNFGHYMLPHPNLRVLAPNVRFFVDHGVKGVFEQGAYQSPGGEFAELKSWMLAKLLWDPSRDGQELIDEFCNGYYGPAAPFILAYIDDLHDTAEATEHYLRISGNLSAPYLSLELMGRAEALFDEAEAAVADDADLLNRVQMARLPIRYVWAMRWHEFQAQALQNGIEWPGPADANENAATFLAVAEANGVTKVSERNMLDTFKGRTVDLGRVVAPPPPGCENLGPDGYIDLQDYGFRLAHEGTWASLKHDDQASDGVAARMPGDHHEWATQRDTSVAGLETDATYTVYASIRVEATADEGPAFTGGVYDIKNRRTIGSTAVSIGDIKGDGYQTYKIATGKLHGQMYIYIAPTRRPDEVQAIWVDRMWLVKEAE